MIPPVMVRWNMYAHPQRCALCPPSN